MSRPPLRLTPRKAIFDALQRCPAGLTLHDLAAIAYRGTTEKERSAVRNAIWRLRGVVRIDTVRDGLDGLVRYRLGEVR